jgi:site-specific DNA recombinase
VTTPLFVAYYRSLKFTPAFAQAVRKGFAEAVEHQHSASIRLRADLEKELATINKKERALLDLASDGILPKETIKENINEYRYERARISERLEAVTDDLSQSIAFIDAAITLLERPGDLYAHASDDHRRLINQALFAKLLVIDEVITDVIFNEPFAELIEAERAFRGSIRVPEGERHELALQILRNNKTAPKGGLVDLRSEALVHAVFCDTGSSSNHMVELRGFEPLTPCMPCRCATNCATAPDVVLHMRVFSCVCDAFLPVEAGVIRLQTTCLDYYTVRGSEKPNGATGVLPGIPELWRPRAAASQTVTLSGTTGQSFQRRSSE